MPSKGHNYFQCLRHAVPNRFVTVKGCLDTKVALLDVTMDDTISPHGAIGLLYEAEAVVKYYIRYDCIILYPCITT